MTPTATARWTGAAYLGLAVAGMLGHLLLTPALVAAGPDGIRADPWLAGGTLAAELLVVIFQALAAWGFFALFRRDHVTAAFGVAAFGMANATLILGSAGFLATAVAVAHDPALAPGGDAVGTLGLLFALSSAAWSVGSVFFGLWLIPMGAFVLTTRRMPRLLGWVLIVGGGGYLLGAVVAVLPGLTLLAELLPYLATVGELWMLGYLLVVGIRRSPVAAPVTA